MKILGIIPARGGSKGIPQKNIKILAGKALIKYTIDSAKKSKINRLIVSTDNKKIASIAKSAGAEIPFLRPKKISGDRSPTIEVIKHTIDFLEKNESYRPDIITILQPTSPLRTAQIIDKSINMLTKSKATSVISVKKVKEHPYGAFTYSSNYLKPYRKNFEKFTRRQDLPDLYYTTGTIYTLWLDTIKKNNSIYGNKIKPFIIKNEIEIDIDSTFDMFLCEMVLKHWNNFKRKFS